MITDNLFKIVLTELTTDVLKTEEELTRVINSDLETNYKIERIKQLLEQLTIKEFTVAKFSNMIKNNNGTNEEQNERN